MSSKRATDKYPHLPAAKMLRKGAYRLINGPGNAVSVRPPARIIREHDALTGADLLLAAVDGGWEQAEGTYYLGLEEGFEMGYAAGLKCGRSEANQTVEAFQTTLSQMEKDLFSFYNGLERWAVKLSMHIAEKVVGKASRESEELVHETVRKAIAEAADKSHILVKVNPADFEALKEFRTNLTNMAEGIEHFKIEADNSITPGSCHVETPSGLLDADFKTQLNEFRRALVLQEETH
ncbi:hypothetical protein KKA08_04155 [bacterium]|nr:hypothetical protein [bacterium]